MIGSEEDPKDWQSAFDAARQGKPFIYPPDVKDLFAWTSGYIEGRRSTLDQTAEDNGIELDPNDAKIVDGRSGLYAVEV